MKARRRQQRVTIDQVTGRFIASKGHFEFVMYDESRNTTTVVDLDVVALRRLFDELVNAENEAREYLNDATRARMKAVTP